MRRHFLGRMPERLAAECADDENDLAEDAAADLEGLTMEDEHEKDEAEMLAGDRPGGKGPGGALGTGEKKKKKKKKKLKKPEGV